MEYEVIAPEGIDNHEFDIYLPPNEIFADGEFEPDLVAGWLSQGLIRVLGAEVEPEPDDE